MLRVAYGTKDEIFYSALKLDSRAINLIHGHEPTLINPNTLSLYLTQPTLSLPDST